MQRVMLREPQQDTQDRLPEVTAEPAAVLSKGKYPLFFLGGHLELKLV